MSAIYANFTGVSGQAACDLKSAIRARIRRTGATITSIYRNPFSPERTKYRFIRVHLKPKDAR